MDVTTLLVLAAVVGLLAVVGYAAVRVRRRRQEQSDAVHHFRCPGCGRRLRFRVRQVGHEGKCSHCGHEVTFPPVSRAID